MSLTFQERRRARHTRIRRQIYGSSERPRLAVYRSSKHLYAQAIDDYRRKTLFSFSTTSGKFQKSCPKGSTVDSAKRLGEVFGPEMLAKGIKKIVLDRGGNRYHGRVKALAESLRAAGVDF